MNVNALGLLMLVTPFYTVCLVLTVYIYTYRLAVYYIASIDSF